MITKINHIISAALVSCGLTAALTACTDSWDDHYEAKSVTASDASLWQAIQQNGELSNFASVVKATGYDKSLASSQVFTVFAPTNSSLSKEQADALISSYNEQKAQGVNDDDNTIIKEFVQNHIALYNYSVSTVSNDSIVLMNGKYAVLKPSAIDDVRMLTANQLYSNGVLFTVERQVEYLPNVFEYVRVDSDLDSLRSFLYNSHFYYKDFLPERSVAGGIENGKTVYLDSVFTQTNELYFYLGRLDSEDSTYYMVAPTNELWRQLLGQYEPYFNYASNVEDRDSLAYTMPRLAIVDGTTFSRTFNTDAVLRDSAMSVSSLIGYSYRTAVWGAPFHYYQYDAPLAEGGVLASTDVATCSNGRVYKAGSQWPITDLQSFNQFIIIEAETSRSIKEVSKTKNPRGTDSINIATPRILDVSSDSRYHGQVWSNSFVEFAPAVTTLNYSVTFNITDVLSNMGYDIYLVTAPILANDSNATQVRRLPTVLRCTLGYNDEQGRHQEQQLVSSVTTNPDVVDYILLAEDFKFPVATKGLIESEPSTTLKVETRVSSRQIGNETHTRTLFIDCILLVPHGLMQVGDHEVLMYPHGLTTRENSYWTKKR